MLLVLLIQFHFAYIQEFHLILLEWMSHQIFTQDQKMQLWWSLIFKVLQWRFYSLIWREVHLLCFQSWWFLNSVEKLLMALCPLFHQWFFLTQVIINLQGTLTLFLIFFSLFLQIVLQEINLRLIVKVILPVSQIAWAFVVSKALFAIA